MEKRNQQNPNSKSLNNGKFLSPQKATMAALITVLGSIATHVYLTFQHYRIHFGIADAKSICNLSSTFNCDSVAVSSFSSFLSVPMSIWGLSSHLILALFLTGCLIGLSQNAGRLLRISWLMSLFFLLTSVVMASLSSLILKTYCLFCIAAYILSLIQFLFISTALPQDWAQDLGSDIQSLFSQSRVILGSLLAIPILAFLGNSMLRDSMAPQIKKWATESILDWKTAPVYQLSSSFGLFKKSEKQPARMTIVEFADYLCPHCKHAGPSIHAFVDSRKDVELIFKAFPLDGTCNPAIEQKGDGLRCQLAYASWCAEKIAQKGFEFQFHIFEKQNEWTLNNLTAEIQKISQQLNVPGEQMTSCMSSSEAHENILNQAKEGAAAKIRGTPSVFVNGKKLEGGQMIPVLEAVAKEI